MTRTARARVIAGWAIHGLIAGLLIFAGSIKVLGMIPPSEKPATPLEQSLEGRLTLFGAGELVTAALLLIPRTLSLGVLMASGFWGGVILFHMMAGDSYASGVVLMLLTWLGAYLRLPAIFSSFQRNMAEPPASSEIP
jgi:hypothetical protein